MAKAKDLTNQRFGKLVVIERDWEYPKLKQLVSRNAFWRCQCDCGNITTVNSSGLKSGNTTSCGCVFKENITNKNSNNLLNQRFGRLTVIEKTSKRINRKIVWKCICDCGKIVEVTSSNLISGNTTSCGCYRQEITSKIGSNNFQDLTNQQFGKLTVIKHLGKNEQGYHSWLCKCECGSEKIFISPSLKNGTFSCGCVQSKGEAKINQILTAANLKFVSNKEYFSDLIFPSGAKGRYDFILLNEKDEPYYLIEFDGKQHFQKVDYFGGEEEWISRKEHDKIKEEYAKNHNLPLVRIPYYEQNNLSLELIFSKKYLMEESKNESIKEGDQNANQ